MKYLRLYESFDEVARICREYNIFNYIINSDGSIDVDESVRIFGKCYPKSTITFNKVNGSFYCAEQNLITLEGCPKEVNGNFYCYGNQLTSLEYAPKIIRGEFNCEDNKIKSFEYFPNYVGDEFWCAGNPIYQVWKLFFDLTKIELLNDYDIFRDEDTDTPGIVMDRLNDFLLTIGNKTVESIDQYKNI